MVAVIKEQKSTEEPFVVTFKGDFLDQLIDARALMEVASKLINHHKEMDIDQQTFMGLGLLMDRIKALLDINANLLPDYGVSKNSGVKRNSGTH